jgi:hypothetical protein
LCRRLFFQGGYRYYSAVDVAGVVVVALVVVMLKMMIGAFAAWAFEVYTEHVQYCSIQTP